MQVFTEEERLNEEWREIPGTKGKKKYYVSSLGRFKCGRKLMEQKYDTSGYLRISIPGRGRLRSHQFVAESFCENPENKPYIDHIDNVKDNNRWWNLEYVTPQENTQRAVDTGVFKGGNGRKNRIVAIDVANHEARIYESQGDAAKAIGNKYEDVNKCLRGKQKTSRGYMFAYLLENDDEKND